MGKEAADLGMQAYGGHGYIKDNKAEQVSSVSSVASVSSVSSVASVESV